MNVIWKISKMGTNGSFFFGVVLLIVGAHLMQMIEGTGEPTIWPPKACILIEMMIISA